MSDLDAQAFLRDFLPQPGESTVEEWDEGPFHIRRSFKVDGDGVEVLVEEEITVGNGSSDLTT